jgi:hypothetical protein
MYCNLPLEVGEHHSCRRAGRSEFSITKDYLIERTVVMNGTDADKID